jgi:hypothetical protein
MTILSSMKSLFALTVAGAALAGLAALVVVTVLVLVVIPGGVGILAIEFERATGWLRPTCAWLLRTNPTIKPESTPC